MLEALRFVQGAVAKKDFAPVLTHFRVEGGRIYGFNGVITLSSPIALDLTATPKAIPFVKALNTCNGVIRITQTATGDLQVSSGAFKALVPCSSDVFPTTEPEGAEVLPSTGDILATLKVLLPFISDDASRAWSRGILFRGKSAYATNNIVVIEKWVGQVFPTEVCIPRVAIVELIRIGEEPNGIQMCETSCTFHYQNGQWLKTQLLSTEWPDLGRVLNQEAKPQAVPVGFFAGVEALSPFVEELGKIYLSKGMLSTLSDLTVGASVEVPTLNSDGCYNRFALMLLEKVATSIDFSLYPAPCLFFGEKVRGAIIGIRV